MIDTLKKIGLPATVSAIIAALITILPFIFKIDERYAKEEDVKAQAEQTEKAINNLALEIGRLAGSQEVMITLMGKKEVRVITAEKPAIKSYSLMGKPEPTPVPVPVIPSTIEVGPDKSTQMKLNAIKRDVQSQQERVRSYGSNQ